MGVVVTIRRNSEVFRFLFEILGIIALKPLFLIGVTIFMSTTYVPNWCWELNLLTLLDVNFYDLKKDYDRNTVLSQRHLRRYDR